MIRVTDPLPELSTKRYELLGKNARAPAVLAIFIVLNAVEEHGFWIIATSLELPETAKQDPSGENATPNCERPNKTVLLLVELQGEV